jgi:hypothetical protein
MDWHCEEMGGKIVKILLSTLVKVSRTLQLSDNEGEKNT